MVFFNLRKKFSNLNNKKKKKKSKQPFSLEQHLPYQSSYVQRSYIDPLKPPDSSLMSDIMNELNQHSAYDTIVTPSDITEKNPAVEQPSSAHHNDFHRTAGTKKRPLSFNTHYIQMKPTTIMHKSKSTIVKLNDIPDDDDDDDDDEPILLKRHSAIEQQQHHHQNQSLPQNRHSMNPIDRMKERHRQEVRISLQQASQAKTKPKVRIGFSPSMPSIYNTDTMHTTYPVHGGIVRSASFATNPYSQQTNYFPHPVQPWSDIIVSRQSHLRYSMVDPRIQALSPNNSANRARMIKSASALTIQQPKTEIKSHASKRPLYYERKIVPPTSSVVPLKCRRISPECCHHQTPSPPKKKTVPCVNIETYKDNSFRPPSPTSPTSTKYSFKQDVKFKLPKKLKRELEYMQTCRSTYSVPDLTEFQKQQDETRRKKKAFWQSIEPCHHHHHHHHHHQPCMKKSNSDHLQYHHHCHLANNNNNQIMT